MSDLTVERLSKRYRGQSVAAVDDVSFTVPEGEMLVLLGHSGSGKTTSLKCVAGLEEPDTGTISLGERVLFDSDSSIDVPTHRREVGLVFQAFALWPHMTARRNIEFPLRSRRKGRDERAAAVTEIARLVELSDELLRKHPGQLSGGQQQRVALARALVGHPGVVLFDEPLSSLDAMLREQLRIELQAMHRRIGFTGIYVTHDLSEALALGTQVAVMSDGRIQQVGRPDDVFERPASATVARLLGFRPLCSLRRADDRWDVSDGALCGDLPDVEHAPPSLDVFVRPDEIEVRASGERPADRWRLTGALVQAVTYLGTHAELVLQLGERVVRTRSPRASVVSVAVGDHVAVDVAQSSVRLFQADGAMWSPAAERHARGVPSARSVSS